MSVGDGKTCARLFWSTPRADLCSAAACDPPRRACNSERDSRSACVRRCGGCAGKKGSMMPLVLARAPGSAVPPTGSPSTPPPSPAGHQGEQQGQGGPGDGAPVLDRVQPLRRPPRRQDVSSMLSLPLPPPAPHASPCAALPASHRRPCPCHPPMQLHPRRGARVLRRPRDRRAQARPVLKFSV